jgi:hypothetical protein
MLGTAQLVRAPIRMTRPGNADRSAGSTAPGNRGEKAA